MGFSSEGESMTKIGIIIGSTRPGRKAAVVASWAYDIAQKRNDAEFELVDIADFNLPLLDEPIPAMFGQYSHDHTRAWSAKIASFDAMAYFNWLEDITDGEGNLDTRTRIAA